MRLVAFVLAGTCLKSFCKSRHRIAAANVEVEGTDVAATTIHALFELDGELHSKMDFSKLDDPKVALLLQLQVLLLDEAWGQKQHRLPKSICIYATLYALTSAMLPSWFR